MKIRLTNLLNKSQRRVLFISLFLLIINSHAVSAETVNYKAIDATVAEKNLKKLLGSIYTDPATYNGLDISASTISSSSQNAFYLVKDISYLEGGQSSHRWPYAPVRNIKIQSDDFSDPLKPTITFRNPEFGDDCTPDYIDCPTAGDVTLTIQNLEINHATFNHDDVDVILAGPDDDQTATVTLNNAKLTSFSSGPLAVAVDQDFVVNVLPGESIIESDMKLGGKNHTFNIKTPANQPQKTSLILQANTINVPDNLTTVNIDNADLILRGSAFTKSSIRGHTTFNVSNGGRLLLEHGNHQPNRIVASEMNFDHAHLSLNRASTVNSRYFKLKDSTVFLEEDSTLEIGTLESEGTSTISVAPFKSFPYSGADLKVKALYLTNSQLTINHEDALTFSERTSVDQGSVLKLHKSTPIKPPGAVLIQDSQLTSDEIIIDGGLVARAEIHTKKMTLNSTGFITPGTGIIPDADNAFIGFINIKEGDFVSNGGLLNMELDPHHTSTLFQPANSDRLQALNGSATGSGVRFYIETVTSAALNGAPKAYTASDYDGKEFTLITASGKLDLHPTILPGASMPALLDYKAYDSPDFSGKDITIKATKSHNALLRHPAATKDAHTASTQTSVVTTTDANGVTTTTATTTTTTPQPSGAAHQTITTTVTKTDGTHTVNSHTQVLPQPTGTANLSNSAQLLVNAAQSGNTGIQQALDGLSNAQVAEHLDSVHAEPYSSNMTISLEHSDMIMNSVFNNAASVAGFSSGLSAGDAIKDNGKRLWFETLYTEGEVNADDDLGDFDYTLSSLILGGDLVDLGSGVLGAFFSYGQHEMDEHDVADQDFSADVLHTGLYYNLEDFGSCFGNWDITSLVGFAYSDNSTRRKVVLGNTRSESKADFDGYTGYLGIRGSKTAYKNDWVLIAPELGFNYSYYYQESIKESGNPDLSLKIDSADAQAIITSAGINALFGSLSETYSLQPIAFVRYEHDWYARDNDKHKLDVALVSNPSYELPFAGQNRGENTFITGLGLHSDMNSALKVNGGVSYAESSHGEEWSLGANLSYLF